MKVLINRYIKSVIAGGLLWIPSSAYAQINVGDLFKKAMGEAQKSINKKTASRALELDALEKALAPSDSVVTVTVTNNYEDSAHTVIRFHRRPPAKLLPPDNADTTQASSTDVKKPKPSLVAEDEPDERGSVYKELGPWVTSDLKEFTLAPGESRTVKIAVKVPPDLPPGEYVTWFAAHVILGKLPTDESARVRISLLPGTQIVSSTKLTLKK